YWLSLYGMRTLAVVVALGAGALVYGAFWTNREQLTELGDHLLQNKRMPEPAGISTSPVLGDSFGIAGSPARVLRIVGPIGETHLRGLAFDTYDLGAWHGGLYGGLFTKASSDDLHADAAGPRAEFTCLADISGVLYLPLNSAGVDARGTDSILSWSRESGAGIRTTAAPPYHYTVIAGATEFAQGPLCAPPLPIYLQRDLAVPATVDPGVRRLALRIGRHLKTPEEKIAAVTNFLMSHYTYSLTIHPGPGDPVSNFLLHRKSAYCEYFASAAALLLRYLDVPTRYVVGYYAHEADGPNVTVVRQWDAHAWAESWVDGVGWVTVDATPGDGRPDQNGNKIPFWTRAWEWLQDESASLRAKLAQLSTAQIAAIVCGIGLVVLFISWLWRRGWRAWMRRRVKQNVLAYSNADQDLQKVAARFEAFLARSGLVCPSGETWQEYLRRADLAGQPAQKQIDLEEARAFIEEYNAARFGEADSGQTAELREKLRQLEETRR
ncbi:MAG TPA: transglutaminase domain-containing protein, partial [Capsulimonadaceae bacterium]|nr:transglutaminase domain-containing protein [Capsulimonadaceae bacterium]